MPERFLQRTLLALALATGWIVPVLANDSAALGGALRNCTPGSFATPHPMLADFTIRHTIAADGDNCSYRQTMPPTGGRSGWVMACAFTPAGRVAYADEMAGRGSRVRWSDECRIEHPNGRSYRFGEQMPP